MYNFCISLVLHENKTNVICFFFFQAGVKKKNDIGVGVKRKLNTLVKFCIILYPLPANCFDRE